MFRKFAAPLCFAAFFHVPYPALAQLPEGPGKVILQQRCGTCHGPEIVRLSRRSADEWRTVVKEMIDGGATVADEQMPVLVEYLAANFAPKDTAAALAAAPLPPQQAADMPADYRAVLDTLGRQGDFAMVLKVSIPRNDLQVVVGSTPRRAFGFGGWVALEVPVAWT